MKNNRLRDIGKRLVKRAQGEVVMKPEGLMIKGAKGVLTPIASKADKDFYENVGDDARIMFNALNYFSDHLEYIKQGDYASAGKELALFYLLLDQLNEENKK